MSTNPRSTCHKKGKNQFYIYRFESKKITKLWVRLYKIEAGKQSFKNNAK